MERKCQGVCLVMALGEGVWKDGWEMRDGIYSINQPLKWLNVL